MKKNRFLRSVLVLVLCVSMLLNTELLQTMGAGTADASEASSSEIISLEDGEGGSVEAPQTPEVPEETGTEEESEEKTEDLPETDQTQPEEVRTEEGPEEGPEEGTEALPEADQAQTEETTENAQEELPEIRTFKNQFVRGADKNEDSGNVQYLWKANTNEPGHRFIFRVSYDISGIKERPAGNIRITIPRQILKDREGTLSDTFEMSLPELEKDPETGDYYPMEEQGEYFEPGTDYGYYLTADGEGNEVIIVTNLREVSAAQNGYFEIAYVTTKKTWEYPDMGENLPFTSKIRIGDAEPIQGEPIPVVINTGVRITSTNKHYPTLFREWDDLWGTRPSDAEDYYYLVWEVASLIENGTQPYTFTLDDFRIEGSVEGGKVDVVGYRLSGEKFFSDKNTVEGQTGSGYRYDYVLTRHDKAHYGESGIREYQITNTEEATVIPADRIDEATSAVATKTFLWELPTFQRPNGHFQSQKYGNHNWHTASAHPYYWDYAYYDLDQFQEENVTAIDAFRYDVWGYGYPYPWTIEDTTGPGGTPDGVVDGLDADDPGAYGQKAVTYELTDNTLYFEEDVTEEDGRTVPAKGAAPLSQKDYELLKLEPLQVTTKRYTYDEESKKFVHDTDRFEERDILEIYGELYDETEKENKWVLAGTLNLGTGEADKKRETGKDYDYLTAFTSSKVVFNSESYDFTGYRLVTSNAYYYTSLRAYPTFRLKNSPLILERTKNGNGEYKDTVRLSNISDFHVYDSTGEEIFWQSHLAIDRAVCSQKESELKKEVVSSGNDVRRKHYTIRWKIRQSETVITGTGARDYIRQDAGTFYDLLPSGAALEKGSVYVTGGNGKIDDSYIEYRQIPNYKDSGRTMLVIHVNKQETHYTAFYNTVHTWDSMADWGNDVLNPVAYAKENKEIKADGTEGYTGIAGGSADDGGGLSENNKELMSGLDSTGDGEVKRFLHTESVYQIDALTSAIAGLKKQVKAEEESAYSYDSVTKPEGNYSYQLRFQNTYTTTSKDMIFFDSLENYVTPEGRKSEWKGTLTGIDVSQLAKKGIAPVCYISEAENLDLYEHHDLADTAIWEKVTKNTDLGRAKAVAIDLRKTEDGGEVILESGDSVTAVLHMRAPKKVEEAQFGTYPVAFNNIYIADTVIGEGGSEESFFIHQDYTTIYYRVMADLKLRKVNAADETVCVPGASYRLSGKSDYGQAVDVTRMTNQEGILSFKEIEKGTYTLKETDCSADWQLDPKEHTLEVDGYGDVYVDGVKVEKVPSAGEAGEGTALWTTKDEPRIHGNITFSKRNANPAYQNEVLEGAEFKLSGTSDYGNEVTKYAVSTERGAVAFTDIELGTYELKETKAPEGYLLNETLWSVNVDENGNVSIRDEKKDEIEKDTKGTCIIRNEERFHGFKLHKIDASNESFPLEGAEFTLTGVSDLGTRVTMTVTTDRGGTAAFTGLEKGSYLLQETKAPYNYSTVNGSTGNREEDPAAAEGETIYRYDLDETKYPVAVDAEGNVTIKGLKEDTFGFVIKNHRHTEKIRIIKKWVDMDEEGREAPLIHVSHKDPNIKGPTVVFEAGEGRFADQTSSSTITYDSATRQIITGSYEQPQPPVKEDGDYIFDGWYLEETYATKFEVGTDGIPAGWQDADWEKTDTIHVYAKYRKLNVVNYVVSLYGIEADTLADGSVSGLTLGPMTWDSWSEEIYNHSHEPSETTASGNAHRCIHDDTWADIIYWSRTDPYVYEQCYGDKTTPSCTKAIEVQIPKDIRGSDTSYWNIINESGGYGSMFYLSLTENARKWNLTQSNEGGWGASHARTTLQTLLTGFPEELQTAIAEKQVSYNTGGGNRNSEIKICNDRLWLLAHGEIYSYSFVSGESAGSYERFQKFGIGRDYYNSHYSLKTYVAGGYRYNMWLRTPDVISNTAVNTIHTDCTGGWRVDVTSDSCGLSPAFCLPGPSGN